MKPLRERNQATIGVITLVVLCLAATGAFFSKELLGNGESYSAHFTESAGLTSGNEVHAAGVKVGEVTDVSLDGNRVLVDFTVDGVRLGRQTTASIRIKTLLGEKYLQVTPRGSGELDPAKTIPTSKTTAPFDIPEAVTELTRTAGRIDTDRLAKSFRVMSKTLEGGTPEMGKALKGLSRLSKTVASRDEKLAKLLDNAGGVSKIAKERNEEVRTLIADGNLLLTELQRRKDAIDSLLRGTRELSTQVRGMIAENSKQLRPALQELDKLTGMLQRNQDTLRDSIKALAPYIRGFTNTTGSGQWYDGYLCGWVPPPISAGPVQTAPKKCEVPVPEEHNSPGGGS
ncbi:phospholipid/cholesterol/gamma-HCH transport system substrate-binding protein [Halopolyspora algeriensis]|uniref:Phospholipid/cholesterol/gamma-HCH transport system substrate-binding protein n=1 Tax=Halopolyspora algeriensis TaxID=1500506 RepID=A0A368VS46_9ACTN|nr:MlaD family protein [Halopolyspora algeriensis]RCW44529.1 phospholipid/cholesterol/gamma-HCH transport system substrate-binding protein [Halopolyspora algeriensis]TQM55889.1 phospholipid/cholesterol/gamma-HCH transport system substrate-binding protein [Halopolyspora algeriensis]